MGDTRSIVPPPSRALAVDKGSAGNHLPPQQHPAQHRAKLQTRLDANENQSTRVERRLQHAQTQLRYTRQQEAKFRSMLNKTSTRQNRKASSQVTTAQLRSQLHALQRIHQEGKSQHKSALLEALQGRQTAEGALREAEKTIFDLGKTAQQARQEASAAQRELRSQQYQSADLCQKLSGSQKQLIDLREEALDRERIHAQSHAEQDNELQASASQVKALSLAGQALAEERRVALEESDRLRAALREAQYTFLQISQRDQHKESALQAALKEIEALSESREMLIALVEHSEQIQMDLLQSNSTLARQLDQREPSSAEGDDHDDVRGKLLATVVQQNLESAALQTDLAVMHDRMALSHDRLSGLNAEHIAVLRTLKELNCTLEVTKLRCSQLEAASQQSEQKRQETLAELDAARTSLRTEKANNERLVHQAEDLRAQLKIHKEQLRGAQDQFEVARVRVAALQDDNGGLLEALTYALPFEESYNRLLSSTKSMLSQLNVTETQLQTVCQENVLLAGHGNTEQKILYLDGIRKQLTEARHRVAELELDLKNERLKAQRLERELGALKVLDVHGGLLLGGSGGRVTRVKSLAKQ